MKTAFRWTVILFPMAAAIALVVATMLALGSSPVRIRIVDSRFHPLAVAILRDGNDPFYLGNQTEGRLRDFLQKKCQLNIKPAGNLSPLVLGPCPSLFGRKVAPCSVL